MTLEQAAAEVGKLNRELRDIDEQMDQMYEQVGRLREHRDLICRSATKAELNLLEIARIWSNPS